jgi:hypothetical protein
MFTAKSALMRFVLGVAVATAGVPALAAQTQEPQDAQDAAPAVAETGAPTIAKAAYRRDKGVFVVTGTGFDEGATVRLNGVVLTGERKFKADKGKLKITMPAGSVQLRPEGQNQLEILQGDLSSGEFSF